MNEEKANEKLSEATAVLARLRETPGAVSPEDCLVLSMALSAFAVRTVRLAQERDEARAEADRLRGLGLLVVQGLEHQVHQGGTCDHGWCVAVRSLRALVDPGVRAATAPTLPPPPEAPRG